MSSLIHNPGPLKFTLKDKNGNLYIGECFAVAMSKSWSAREGIYTTIQFTGHKIRQVLHAKKKKAKKKTKKRVRK